MLQSLDEHLIVGVTRSLVGAWLQLVRVVVPYARSSAKPSFGAFAPTASVSSCVESTTRSPVDRRCSYSADSTPLWSTLVFSRAPLSSLAACDGVAAGKAQLRGTIRGRQLGHTQVHSRARAHNRLHTPACNAEVERDITACNRALDLRCQCLVLRHVVRNEHTHGLKLVLRAMTMMMTAAAWHRCAIERSGAAEELHLSRRALPPPKKKNTNRNKLQI